MNLAAAPHLPSLDRAEPAAKPAARIPWLYALMLAAWMFDFQAEGEAQGVAIQAVFLAVYLFALALFAIADRAAGQIRGLRALLGAGALYLGVGIASGIVEGQAYYPILRNALSVFVYLSMAYATARVVLTTDAAVLRRVLAAACLIYAIAFFFIFGFLTEGVNFARVRYQIIGTSSLAALGYVTLTLLFRLTIVELVTLFANGAILLASVTRSFILAFAAQFMIMLIEFRRVFTPRLLVAALLAGVAMVGVLTFGQNQVLRWEVRLGVAGNDRSEYQSYYTRLSEWQFMADEWTESTERFLFGAGIAAPTTFYYGREYGGRSESMIGFGHNQHLSMLFNAGAVGALPLLLLQFLQGALAFRFLRNTVRYRQHRTDLLFLGAWGSLIVLGNLAANFLTASYVLRGTALWYGLGTGLLLGVQARFDPANSLRRPASNRVPTPRRAA